MKFNDYDKHIYSLTAAIFDDTIDYFYSNIKALCIIADHSNCTPDDVKEHLRGVNPWVFIDIDKIQIKSKEVGSTIYSYNYNGNKSPEMVQIALAYKPTWQLENFIRTFNDTKFRTQFKDDFNIIQGYDIREIYVGSEIDSSLLEPIFFMGFSIATTIIHEFLHYLGWMFGASIQYSPVISEDYINQNLKSFPIEDTDEYRVQLCQQQLYNFPFPYVNSGNIDLGLGDFRMRDYSMLKQGGMFDEWKICFRRFKFKVFSEMRSFRRTTNTWNRGIDFRNTR